MALTKLTKDMAIIQKLDDEPNDVGGLTAAQLKAKFDEAGEAIKAFLNETLLSELGGDNAAGSLGAVLNGEKMSVQDALDLLQLASVQAGNVPVGGGAGYALCKKSDETYDMEWVLLRPISTGTYTGTGVYGSENPCSLTFDFVPKLVVVMRGSYATPSILQGQLEGWFWIGQPGLESENLIKFSLSEKTLSWYNMSSAEKQQNAENITYYWFAIG